MICNDCGKQVPMEYANVGVCPWCLDIEEELEQDSDMLDLIDRLGLEGQDDEG